MVVSGKGIPRARERGRRRCCNRLLAASGAAAIRCLASRGGQVRLCRGRARRASPLARARGAACPALERVVLVARELAVVVAIELAEARLELGSVARLVARDVAVVIAVELVEASARARPGAARRVG